MGKLICLKVGFGDASIITSGTATFLVDCHNIGNFSYLLPNDKHLRGVFITHQHNDHFSGLNYLKQNYYGGFNSQVQQVNPSGLTIYKIPHLEF